MGRPFAAPPGVPAERIALLRQAFDATLRDPQFLADAKKLQMEIDPLKGEENRAAPEDGLQRARADRRPRGGIGALEAPLRKRADKPRPRESRA
jgi:hypothetical protein